MQKNKDQIKIDELLEKIMFRAGILGDEKRRKFLNPDYEKDGYNPNLLPDIEKAVERIFSALTAGEKIAVYADYDCDGIPGATMMGEFLKDLGARNLEVYIPDRNTLGYGLHKNILENIISSQVTLLITIDLGTTAREAIDFAEQSGVNVIVIDHHEVPEVLPKPFALINPKLPNSKYPFRELCGTGVAFKVICAFLEKYSEYFNYKKGKEKWFLDLVALSTIADQVPLVDENRLLAKYGLLVMRKGKRHGLRALAMISRVNLEKINEDDINFSIAPKINAASRMDEAFKAYELLSAKDQNIASVLAQELSKLSDKRKIIVAQMMKEAKKHIKERAFENVICIGSPNWNPGLLGILASKIAEEYKKNTFVWGRTNGDKEIIKGSCRSFGDHDVVSIMRGVDGVFLEVGGHKKAGGFSVQDGEIYNLPMKLEESFKNLNKIPEEKDSTNEVFDFDPIFIQKYAINEIEKMAPFGAGNPKPVFIIRGAYVENIKFFGKEKNHLELTLSFAGQKIQSIAFFKKPEDYSVLVEKGKILNIFGFLEKNIFGNFEQIRIRIENIN